MLFFFDRLVGSQIAILLRTDFSEFELTVRLNIFMSIRINLSIYLNNKIGNQIIRTTIIIM